jgi:recombination protein RecR
MWNLMLFLRFAKGSDMSAFHNYPSKLLEQAVREFASLPGIGNKTALRLVLHLLKQEEEDVLNFGNAIIELKRNIHHCKICCNISDTETCQICSNPRRDANMVCVVENIRDVMSIENTSQYNGLYHVLGGIISPIDGIGPSDLTVDSLEERVRAGGIDEVILALSTTMEGDTTNFYIYKKLKAYPVKVSALARGLAIGDELEYADEITLGRSIVDRTPFEATFGGKKQGNSI